MRLLTVRAVKIGDTTLQLEDSSKIYLAQPSCYGEKWSIGYYTLLYFLRKYYILRFFPKK
nr:MAG TPA: hypothetical protein [Bacteriophage sp.]